MKKRKLKRQSLKVRYRRAIKRFEERLIEEQTLKTSLGRQEIENINYGLFKRLNFEDIYKEGITRKVNGRTIRFKGKEAIELQIKSLYNRTNIVNQKEIFINNYLSAMENSDYNANTIKIIKNKLNSLSPQELSIAINENFIPQVYYLYGNEGEDNSLLKRFELLNENFISKIEEDISKEYTERKELITRLYELNKKYY